MCSSPAARLSRPGGPASDGPLSVSSPHTSSWKLHASPQAHPESETSTPQTAGRFFETRSAPTAHKVRPRPVSGSWIRPRRPSSNFTASPGGLSSMRTLAELRRRQLRRWTKRCREAYETEQPCCPAGSRPQHQERLQRRLIRDPGSCSVVVPPTNPQHLIRWRYRYQSGQQRPGLFNITEQTALVRRDPTPRGKREPRTRSCGTYNNEYSIFVRKPAKVATGGDLAGYK